MNAINVSTDFSIITAIGFLKSSFSVIFLAKNNASFLNSLKVTFLFSSEKATLFGYFSAVSSNHTVILLIMPFMPPSISLSYQ